MKSNDRNRPVPAAIDGRRWTVRDSAALTGGTDLRKCDMFAPQASTPMARLIRNHELIHAKITPRVDPVAAAKKHETTVDALQWSEDYRVHLLQRRAGLVDPEALDGEEIAAIVKNVAHSRRMAAGAIMALYPLRDQRNRLASALVEIGGWTPVDVAAVLDAISDMADTIYRPYRGRREKTRRTAQGFAKLSAPLARAFDLEFPADEAPSSATRPEKRKVDAIRGAGKWGRLLDVRRLKMPRAVKPRRPIGRRFNDCGVIPTAVHRLPVDGAIFSTRRRAKGGTILCDMSGSMGYCDDDVDRILRDAPAATIAFYAGGYGRGHKPIGRISIAADRGRAAEIDDVRASMPGGDNLIDGPALRWLAKQPAPRYWISDEGVGGVSDFGIGGACHAECRAICTAANITIVESIDQLK